LKAPYTERYVRCCERTGVSRPLLLDRSGERDTMCAIVEEYAKEVSMEDSRQAMLKGFKNGLTKETAKAMYPKIKKTVIDSIYLEAQKAASRKRNAKA